MNDTSWYTDDIKAKVKRMGAVNPSLDEEFFQQVIQRKRDWTYWSEFKAELCNDDIAK
jgi:hypothetical protein